MTLSETRTKEIITIICEPLTTIFYFNELKFQFKNVLTKIQTIIILRRPQTVFLLKIWQDYNTSSKYKQEK